MQALQHPSLDAIRFVWIHIWMQALQHLDKGAATRNANMDNTIGDDISIVDGEENGSKKQAYGGNWEDNDLRMILLTAINKILKQKPCFNNCLF